LRLRAGAGILDGSGLSSRFVTVFLQHRPRCFAAARRERDGAGSGPRLHDLEMSFVLFVGVPKLVIVLVIFFFLFGVPLMCLLVTLREHRRRREMEGKGDSR